MSDDLAYARRTLNETLAQGWHRDPITGQITVLQPEHIERLERLEHELLRDAAEDES